MGEGPQCPKCGTAVQPDWDWCHACGFDPEGRRPVDPVPTGATGATGAPPPGSTPPPFTAPGVAPPNPSVGPAPAWGAPPPGGPPGAPVWTPAVAPAKSSNGTLRNLLIVLGGLAVIGVVALVVFGPKLLKAAEGTKAGAGAKDPVTYTSPDGALVVDLSGSPSSRNQTTADGTPMSMWGWDGGANGQFVIWADLPAGYQPSMDERLLDAFIDGAITGHGVTTTVTFAGHPARRFTGTFDDFDGVGVVFISGSRLYVVLAGGPWASKDPQAQAFLDSFQFTSP
jgi:hypothetical protein